METVDTKQLDDEINDLESLIESLEIKLIIKKNKLVFLKERKKSIELYNKK